MTRKRTRLELFIDVLTQLSSGVAKPTNIMYKCNLSWRPLQEILDSMVQQGLIETYENKKRRTYGITSKGVETLRYIEKARELVVIEK